MMHTSVEYLSNFKIFELEQRIFCYLMGWIRRDNFVKIISEIFRHMKLKENKTLNGVTNLSGSSTDKADIWQYLGNDRANISFIGYLLS